MSAAVVDLRYFLIPIINMLKSLASPDSWDPFTILGDPTWSKICLALAFAAFFSFVSVTPSSSSSSPVFEFRPRGFSPRFCFSYLASLILPQLLFCYLYPTMLLLSTDLAVAFFIGFGRSLQPLLSSMQGFNIHIIAPHAIANSDAPDLEMEEDGSSPPPTNSDG